MGSVKYPETTTTTKPTKTDAEVEAAILEERKLARTRKGRKASIYTDTKAEGTSKKSLLGE